MDPPSPQLTNLLSFFPRPPSIYLVPILFVREDGSIAKETTMSAILPDSFGPENLLDVIE